MKVGNAGVSSPYAGNAGSSPSASAGNGQTTQDLQDQKDQNAFQEEITKESNMEAKRNQTRMGVIGNLK
jgi:serine protease inhibitor ecotin